MDYSTMSQRPYSIPQTDPPLSPRETLPTMYDLPSEDPEEPGLPDEFHDLQPQLLSATLRLQNYAKDQIFTGTDLNLYYDVHHPLWHKRPDWFLALGVPRLYDGKDLRASYVVWQEGVNPFVVVELLSPGTEDEDLGRFAESNADIPLGESIPAPDSSPAPSNGQSTKAVPPGKWQVYEQILRIPYYVVFSRYNNRVRAFRLVGGHYQEQNLDTSNPRVWIPELDLGLGLWEGEFDGIERSWLRWYDTDGNWVLTEAEHQQQRAERQRQRAIQERQRAEQEQQRAEQQRQRAEQEQQRAEQQQQRAEQEQQRAEQQRQRAEQEQQRAEQQRQRAEQEQQRADTAEDQLRQVVMNLLQANLSVAQVANMTGLTEDQVRQMG
ncbi:MAG: Uma2 family endonuclease [Timaviella obliquedivisa GSE-PSE-MK23-08B]|jgi:Uma2 family endonuclease|nr:Uma2 family endonuclease [Timaviella obliquedivisa GSE-PSE-MK23-08B]